VVKRFGQTISPPVHGLACEDHMPHSHDRHIVAVVIAVLEQGGGHEPDRSIVELKAAVMRQRQVDTSTGRERGRRCCKRKRKDTQCERPSFPIHLHLFFSWAGESPAAPS